MLEKKNETIPPFTWWESWSLTGETNPLLLTSAAVAKNPIRCQAPGGIAVSAEKNQFKPPCVAGRFNPLGALEMFHRHQSLTAPFFFFFGIRLEFLDDVFVRRDLKGNHRFFFFFLYVFFFFYNGETL